MIRELILPQLAMGMSEATIIEWMVPEGSLVQRDQPLVSIETEKVVTELPAPYNGYLHHVAKAGDVLPVENLMGHIAETEAEYQSLCSGGAEVAGGTSNKQIEPKAEAIDPTSTSGGQLGRVRASGLAKAIARQKGIDLSSITGSGPGGRIVRRDVEASLSRPMSMSKPATTSTCSLPAQASAALREKARIPLTGMRKVIAERMVASKQNAAHTYVFFEIDITKLIAARQTLLDRAESLGTKVSLAALQIKAVAAACRQVPICNATLSSDAITVWENVNVGLAVALPGKGEYDSGLVVPVIRNADAKSLLQIDADIKTLVGRARKGELTADDMAEGTITMSSTGGFAPGSWAVSTPLLNLPQVINFQPGSPIEKPIVVDGQVAVRTVLPCGLSFDHRAMDGAPVGKFVQSLIDLLSHPELMLL